MRIKINSFKTHDSNDYLKVMSYVNELIIKHDNVSGNFDYINLNDYAIAQKHKLCRVNSDGIVTMTNTFYDCLKVLEYIGILIKTDSYSVKSKATRYSIEKHLFLILLCVLISISHFSQKQIKRLNKLEFGSHLKDIVNKIKFYTKNKRVYSIADFDNVLKPTYCCLNSICDNAINTKNNVYTFNEYVMFYKEVINNNVTLSHYLSMQYHFNKLHLDIVPYIECLSLSWFTECYSYETKKDLKKLENYYDEVMVDNNYFKRIIEILDEKYDKVGLSDFIIEKSLFNKIPGNTMKKKEEILSDIVKHWVIKNSKLLNYCLGIVDNLRDLKDDYKMDVHITITEVANQYGINKLIVHVSGRMANDFCNFHKKENCDDYKESREYELERLGFDDEAKIDLHSSIFSIAKSLNKHTALDLTYDIKKELESLNITGVINKENKLLKAKDYKGIGFYVFFGKDIEDAYKTYANRFNSKKHVLKKQFKDYYFDEISRKSIKRYINYEKGLIRKTIPEISLDSFLRVYNCVSGSVGNTAKYANNIFVIESAIMALTINKLSNMGFSIKNVYDCIWWKSSEISKEEVSKVLVESATAVFDMYYTIASEQNNGL